MRSISKVILFILLLSNIVKADNGDKVSNKIGEFTARIIKGEVELNWRILNPNNLSKFKIESKKAGTENYISLTDVLFYNFRKKDDQDSVTSYYYTYSDKPEENGVYFYKVSVFDIFNKIVEMQEIKIGITEVPEFKLQQNSPNPFNPSTTISYQLLIPTHVKLNVYSLTGQFIDLLVDNFQTPGTYTIDFNATKYNELSSGIYFYKLETNYSSDIKKMIFTK